MTQQYKDSYELATYIDREPKRDVAAQRLGMETVQTMDDFLDYIASTH